MQKKAILVPLLPLLLLLLLYGILGISGILAVVVVVVANHYFYFYYCIVIIRSFVCLFVCSFNDLEVLLKLWKGYDKTLRRLRTVARQHTYVVSAPLTIC